MKKIKINTNEIEIFVTEAIQKLLNNFKNKSSLSIDDILKFTLDEEIKKLQNIPEDIKKPKVFIEADAYIKMLELIRQSDVEISWHGLVERNLEENTYTVYDILVFPQINTATTTTGDEEKFAEWQMGLIQDMDFPYEDLRMHGHSHVNMSVFSSGVDDQYQKDILAKVKDGDYYLFLIMNKKLEICPLLYDFNQKILFEKDDIKIEIVSNYEGGLRNWASNQISKYCKTQSFTYSRQKNYYPRYAYEYEDEYFKEREASILEMNTKPIFGGQKNGSK